MNEQVPVLVAHRDSSVRVLITALLRLHGRHVVEADDGQRALDLWDVSSPLLTVLGRYLPTLDGLQVVSRIRARDSDHPILLLVPVPDAEVRRSAQKLGVDRVVPFSEVSSVAEIVEEMLADHDGAEGPDAEDVTGRSRPRNDR